MKYSLKNNSVAILRQILVQPGACRNIDDIYLGGKLLSQLPKILPSEKDDRDGLVEIEISGSERDVIKTALNTALEKQQVPASEYIVDLIEKLEFAKK